MYQLLNFHFVSTDMQLYQYAYLVCDLTAPKQEEDMKVREKVLHNLRVKGAFGAQELYDKHRGMLDH